VVSWLFKHHFKKNTPYINPFKRRFAHPNGSFFPKNIQRQNNLSPTEYASILSDIATKYNLWQTTYYHELPTYHDIIESFRTTHLRPYFSVLPLEKQSEFEFDLVEILSEALISLKNGMILLPFPRLFFTAMR